MLRDAGYTFLGAARLTEPQRRVIERVARVRVAHEETWKAALAMLPKRGER